MACEHGTRSVRCRAPGAPGGPEALLLPGHGALPHHEVRGPTRCQEPGRRGQAEKAGHSRHSGSVVLVALMTWRLTAVFFLSLLQVAQLLVGRRGPCALCGPDSLGSRDVEPPDTFPEDTFCSPLPVAMWGLWASGSGHSQACAFPAGLGLPCRGDDCAQAVGARVLAVRAYVRVQRGTLLGPPRACCCFT